MAPAAVVGRVITLLGSENENTQSRRGLGLVRWFAGSLLLACVPSSEAKPGFQLSS